MNAAFSLHLFATIFMTGVIWIVQVLHYPMFADVWPAAFPGYAQEHAQRISVVVVPAMLVELGCALLLALDRRPEVGPRWMGGVGLALLLVIWGSTFLVQVPLHAALRSGFDAELHRQLVATNWVRTLAWTARAGLVSFWLLDLLTRARPAIRGSVG